MNLTQLEVGRGLVALHLLLDKMKPRLQTILDMNDRRPSSVADLLGEPGAGARVLAIPDEMVSICRISISLQRFSLQSLEQDII